MGMAVETITIDCSEPDRLAAWWARALRGAVTAVMPGEFVLVMHDGGPKLGFQRVDDPTPGKNRVHVDFSVADLETEVERLVSLGATETAHLDVLYSHTTQLRGRTCTSCRWRCV